MKEWDALLGICLPAFERLNVQVNYIAAMMYMCVCACVHTFTLINQGMKKVHYYSS